MGENVMRCTLAVLILAAGGAAQTTIAARLLTPVSSYRTRAGTAVEAVLTTPLCAEGGTRLPDGITLHGVVRRIHKVGLGLIHETAGILLEFRALDLPDGSGFPVTARLEDVVNARERVDKRGRIHGIRATATLSNRFGERLALAALGHPLALIPVFALETAVLPFPDPEIDYGPGTEIEVAVQFPGALGTVAACPVGEPVSPAAESGLRALVGSVPVWSYAQGQPQDPVNLIYIGSKEEVQAAFAAAGWTGSLGHTAAARFNAARAIAEDRAFTDAPMRTLLLNGDAADLSLQKTLDTFEKRDHLRIWNRSPEQWEGRPVWASAATRDIGTGFTLRPFGFAHRIQNDVDEERDRVVHGLAYTGCVDSIRYVPRESWLASGGDYRKGIESDGRVAVLALNSCREPRLAITEPAPGPPPPLAVRCVRRVTLTARNHFLRDNIVWRSADAARIGIVALRQWWAERKAESAHARLILALARARASLQ
jgi:LssY C-terminus